MRERESEKKLKYLLFYNLILCLVKNEKVIFLYFQVKHDYYNIVSLPLTTHTHTTPKTQKLIFSSEREFFFF